MYENHIIGWIMFEFRKIDRINMMSIKFDFSNYRLKVEMCFRFEFIGQTEEIRKIYIG